MNPFAVRQASALRRLWHGIVPIYVKQECVCCVKIYSVSSAILYSTDMKTLSATGSPDIQKKEKISKAMKAYLERARKHDEFMKQQEHEFKLGKRHLANMMGEDPDTFTQEDIDNAIHYLFPSGLFDPKARPIMKPPEEVFPQKKAAEFDETGRPYHFLFYTGKPNYFGLLHDIVSNLDYLNKHEDRMIRKHLKPESDQALDVTGTEWLPKESLEKLLVERLHDTEYNSLLLAMDRLLKHPYSFLKKDFILQYRKPLIMQTRNYEIPKPELGEDGKQFVTVKQCLRKSSRGEVTIRYPGEGKFQVNGCDINYFRLTQEREQLLFPLIFTGMLNKVDVEAVVTGGGPSGQAGAIRWGIAWGLRSFVDEEMLEKMRLAGLLTRDYRRRERKKPGQEKARKKFTWKKR
ncbi:28S ribosomal protein S9, mitochondrial [Schistocerca gregaria]|uniref:28S ribosomal protein S9, mitochondrial n=1 Tax=Schistocerca gregaria TaxID=7010 RepID=UPI00211DE7C1|nr:28S ribosomal protein S9, mitochondrial [Schistocerca gregaria]